MGYQAMILLPTKNTVTRIAIEQKLLDLFTEPVLNVKNLEIKSSEVFHSTQVEAFELHYDFFTFRFWLNSESYVIEEAQEMLENIASTDKSIIYDTRIEIASDDDPNMDYFNHYLWIVEELSTFEGAVAFDPTAFDVF